MNSATDNTATAEIREVASSWPAVFDWGLLCLRAWFGLSLFLKHGWEKPTHFAQMVQRFPDPLHLGPVPSLIVALTIGCDLLDYGPLWFRHTLGRSGDYLKSLYGVELRPSLPVFRARSRHGELVVLYLGGFLTSAMMGPGHFTLDYRLRTSRFT